MSNTGKFTAHSKFVDAVLLSARLERRDVHIYVGSTGTRPLKLS